MKKWYKLALVFTICFCGHLKILAQSGNATNDLIKQGVDLHNQGKYADAIDKFTEALKSDPENEYANYEIAFSLYASKKPQDAIPHLQKAIKSNNKSLSVTAYSLLASIYDEANQSQKAIEIYNQAIKTDPDYLQIYYNLGIAYFRNKQYAEAENSAIEAIKHNPKNASSQRLYALVTFHQNERAKALLGFCSFLLLEPAGQRATEVYGNIQHLIQGGILTDNKGKTTISISPQQDKENNALNLGISLVVKSGQSQKLAGADLLEYELKSIFALVGQLSEKKTNKDFFDNFFAAYFYKLAQSGNMPAFTHTIVLANDKTEGTSWASQNPQQVTRLNEWLKTTERAF